MSGTTVVRTRSIRVALAATLVVAVVYAAIAGAVVLFATRDLTAMIDQRLAGALERVPPDGFGGGFPVSEGGPRPDRDPGRPYGAPFLVWIVRDDGAIVAPTGNPALPEGLETATEYRILELLLRRAPSVVDRKAIAEHAWADETDPLGSNAIDVQLSHLRAKLPDAGMRIVTVRGAGYRVEPE